MTAAPATPAGVGLAPEHELLLACVRRSLLAADVRPPAGPVDWNRVLEITMDDGLASLVLAGLADAPDLVPSWVRAQLRALRAAEVVRAEEWVRPVVRRALGALHDRGLRPVVLKGAALAYLAYPEPVQRTFSDLDLLLPPEQLDAASDALVGVGFETDTTAPAADHHLPARRLGEGYLGVELHGRLLPKHSPYRLAEPELIQRSSAAEVAGGPAWVLQPDDALHVACVHLSYAHRYRWHPLRALADLLAITATWRRDLDWDRLVASVRRAGTAGAVYWPLLLAREWLGAPVPARAVTALAPSRAAGRLFAAVADPAHVLEGARSESAGGSVLDDLLVDLSLRQGCSVGEQARAVGRRLFPSPDRVGHLDDRTTASPVRYAAYLARPRRLLHGATAAAALLHGAAADGARHDGINTTARPAQRQRNHKEA